ncbi:hypothetical protein JKP88DRAFT_282850 [Tribonema minus]|uniref:Uncharacterized protein n=1 Tax=Tribonema minus TaxID=303371 RepID=A0A835YKU6_9STRA|nr:hypothetical protein JKP88DRAFT_282850 [Tribonema minus]
MMKTIAAAVLAISALASAAPAPATRCPTTATPADYPKCITSFDSCEPVATCDNVMWDKEQALCFDGCASAEYSNGSPVCLATEAEGACVVVWNGGVPECLTDHCNARVEGCTNIGWCHAVGEPSGDGVYCFDGCTAGGIINWSPMGVPFCDDHFTPCPLGPHPHCYNAGGTLSPASLPTFAPTAAPTSA